MLPILSGRLGQPNIDPPNAFSFNDFSVSATGVITIEKGAGRTDVRAAGDGSAVQQYGGKVMIEKGAGKTEKRTFAQLGGIWPGWEGMGTANGLDLVALYDDSQSLNESALTIPPRDCQAPGLMAHGGIRYPPIWSLRG